MGRLRRVSRIVSVEMKTDFKEEQEALWRKIPSNNSAV